MQQGYIISQRKTGWVGLYCFAVIAVCCFGVRLRKSAGDIVVSSVRID